MTCLIGEQSLELYEMLGNGAFGYVRRAKWAKNPHKKVNQATSVVHGVLYIKSNNVTK